MKVRKELIHSYLRNITNGRAVNMEDPMSDLSNFDADVRSMRRAVRLDNDENWLRLSMDALIANPAGRIEQFSGYQFPFNERELVELFTYAYKMIWPEEEISMPGQELDFEFVDMSKEDWAVYTAD